MMRHNKNSRALVNFMSLEAAYFTSKTLAKLAHYTSNLELKIQYTTEAVASIKELAANPGLFRI